MMALGLALVGAAFLVLNAPALTVLFALLGLLAIAVEPNTEQKP